MVKVLLENSAQIDAKTRDGLTPLHCAAISGHEQVITTLLEHSAPISARTKVRKRREPLIVSTVLLAYMFERYTYM